MKTGNHELLGCNIFIDKEGRWYHEGAEMINRNIVDMFFSNLDLTEDGLYVVNWNGKRFFIDVEDTAFVVRKVLFIGGAAEGKQSYQIHLSDDTTEELLPETLWVGDKNVLYCRVKQGRFPARFNRPAYYQITAFMLEKEGGFYLPLNGKTYCITGC